MTKAQQQTLGTQQGTAAGLFMTEATLREPYVDVRASVIAAATSAAGTSKSRDFEREAFVAAAMKVYDERRNALPDIKAERRLSSTRRWLDGQIADSQATIAEFVAKLASTNDVSYEMRWRAESAMKAAALQTVATKLRSIVEEQGVDAALESAQREALRMTRSFSHSTSFVSNEMEHMTAAVYADFCDNLRFY